MSNEYGMSSLSDDDNDAPQQTMSREEFFRQPRNYFCRKCAIVVNSSGLPMGWLLILIGKGNGGKPAQVGVYCTFLCAVEDCFGSVRTEYSNMRRNMFNMQTRVGVNDTGNAGR